MPFVVDPQSGERYWVDGAADVAEAVRNGYTLEDASATVPMVTPGGSEVAVPVGKLDPYTTGHPMDAALNPVEAEQRGYQAFQAQELEDQYGGIGGDARALVEGGLSGLTLGGYDVLAKAVGADTEKYAQANPRFRMAGEVAGVVGGALAGSGVEALSALAGSPAALVSRGSLALGEGALGAGAAGRIAGQALEGGAYAAAQTTSQILLDDDPLAGEAAVAEVARSALYGAVLSGGTAGVFEGLGAVGNRLIKGLDDANPVLNMRGDQGKHIAGAIGKAVTDVDSSVEEAVTQAERHAGLGTRLAQNEREFYGRWDHDLRTYGDDVERVTQVQAETHVKQPHGIADFNERVRGIHDDLELLLGPEGMAGPHGLALDEAGDKLFKALASNEPKAIQEAIPGFKKVVKRIGKYSTTHDFSQDIEALGAFSKRLSEPAEVGLDTAVEDLYAKYKSLRADFEATGGLEAGALEKNVLEATPAAAARHVAATNKFIAATHELGEAVGYHGDPAQLKSMLEDLGPALEGLTIPHEPVDMAHITNLRKAQSDMKFTLGLAEKEPLTTEHVVNLVNSDVEDLAPKLHLVDRYFKQAREFGVATKDDLLVARLDRMEGEIQDATNDALNGANLGRATKEALGMLLGAEVLQFTGLDGPMDNLLQLAALHKLLKVGGSKVSRSRGGFLRHVMRRMGGSMAGNIAQKAGVAGAGGVLGTAGSVLARTGGYSAGGWLHSVLQGQAGLAGLAGKTRGAIGAMLDGVGKAGRTVARPGALSVAWMARSRFDLGMNDGKAVLHPASEHREGLHAAFIDRSRELARFASNPVAAQAVIHEKVRPLRLLSEKLADQVEMHSMDIPMWLYDKMPKDPGTMQTLGVSRWQANEVDILEFGEYGKGALYPMETMQGALDGDMSPQAAESLRQLWPEHFRELQMQILQRAPELAEKLSYPQMTRLSILMDAPVDSTMDPEFRQFMLDQEAQAMAAQEESMASPAGSSTSSSSPEAEGEYSPSQKLLVPR